MTDLNSGERCPVCRLANDLTAASRWVSDRIILILYATRCRHLRKLLPGPFIIHDAELPRRPCCKNTGILVELYADFLPCGIRCIVSR